MVGGTMKGAVLSCNTVTGVARALGEPFVADVRGPFRPAHPKPASGLPKVPSMYLDDVKGARGAA